jgi:hypothetical protein
MQHAYLIQAHYQPLMLKRLVTALNTESVFFFIHIDAKSDLAPFQAALQEVKNVQFVQPRVRVNWMGYSAVAAQLALLQTACNLQQFDYYSLLSGSDYPIKSNRQIEQFLTGNHTEYINYWKLSDRPSWLDKIEYHYLTDRFPIRDYYPKITLRGLYWRAFFRLKPYLPKRPFLAEITPYGGSQWWTLTHDCVELIQHYLDTQPEFIQAYKNTLSPDEMVFQTIVLNSKFAATTQNFQQYEEWSRTTSDADKFSETQMLPEVSFNLRYIDWSGNAKVNGDRGWPASLDDRDFEALEHSAALFARKFDPEKSAPLLDRIDRELLDLAA